MMIKAFIVVMMLVLPDGHMLALHNRVEQCPPSEEMTARLNDMLKKGTITGGGYVCFRDVPGQGV